MTDSTSESRTAMNNNNNNDTPIGNASSSGGQMSPVSGGLIAPQATAVSSTEVVADNQNKINYEKPLLQRIGSLVESGELTDVKFLIGEKKVEIRAHKLILALSSPVFTSMFYSPYESQNVIEIPDCQPEAFQAMIQFMYTGVAFLTKDVPLAVSSLYVARKYALKGLEDTCLRILSSCITPENVFEILETADFYSVELLEKDCWEFIETKTMQVIRTHKRDLSQGTLVSILKNPRLSMKEIDLFEMLMEWSEEKCTHENLPVTPENKLSMCNEALSLIRFPTMKSSEFASKVVPTGVLSVEQIAKIFTYISAGNEQRQAMLMDFPVEKREPKVAFSAAGVGNSNAMNSLGLNLALLQMDNMTRLLRDAREIDLAIQAEDIQFVNGVDETAANQPAAGRARRGSRRSRRRNLR